jgi:Arc/MetJ family transcription regulator
MSTITFDTLKFAERLKAAGVPSEQAIAEAEALRDVLGEALDTTLATKSDVAGVKVDLAQIDAKVDKLSWMMGILIALAVANFAKQFF